MQKFNIIKIAVPILLLFLLFSSCKEEAKTKVEVSQKEELNEWFDLKYEALLQMSPMHMTYLGRKDQYNQMDDFSEAADDKKLELYTNTTNELKENLITRL